MGCFFLFEFSHDVNYCHHFSSFIKQCFPALWIVVIFFKIFFFSDTFSCFWKSLEIPVKWCLCLLPKHELLAFPLRPSQIISIIINYIQMIFLGLTSASDVHKSSCFRKNLNKCVFVLSGQGGACADIYFFGGKDSWLVSSYHFCLKCQISGEKNPTGRNGIVAFGLATGLVGLFYFFFMDLTELLP